MCVCTSSSNLRKLFNICYFGRSSDLLVRCATLPSRFAGTVDLSIARGFWLSLQQRVCSGFAPDSLFIVFSEEMETQHQNSMAKLILLTYFIYLQACSPVWFLFLKNS